jgi:beta-glucosidase-like glycosyl hydrolase
LASTKIHSLTPFRSNRCSYNKINQTQACQNSKIINGLLKEELDFQGFMMSDWTAMLEGVQPALAGLDMNMPGFPKYGQGEQNFPDPVNATNSFWGAALVTSVQNGSVPQSRVDDMVTRQLAAFYKLGQVRSSVVFNTNVPDELAQDSGYPAINFDVNHRAGLDLNVNVQGNHSTVIRQIGGASIVLAKNNGSILPLVTSQLKSMFSAVSISHSISLTSGAFPFLQVLGSLERMLVQIPLVPTAAAIEDATSVPSRWAGEAAPLNSRTSLIHSLPLPRTSTPAVSPSPPS